MEMKKGAKATVVIKPGGYGFPESEPHAGVELSAEIELREILEVKEIAAGVQAGRQAGRQAGSRARGESMWPPSSCLCFQNCLWLNDSCEPTHCLFGRDRLSLSLSLCLLNQFVHCHGRLLPSVYCDRHTKLLTEGGVMIKFLTKGDGWKKPKDTDIIQLKYTVTLATDWSLKVCLRCVALLCVSLLAPPLRPHCTLRTKPRVHTSKVNDWRYAICRTSSRA
eukprot:SAG22_NODE_101_length_20519_cov_15.588002_26_plen_222_part_00